MLLVVEAGAADAPRRLNVLFIAIDDLRPQLKCYGHDEMVTPSLDRLAREGRQFNRHFVQVPTCGASRCALLTGRYPAEPRAYDNGAFATLPRERTSAQPNLPWSFQQHGYRTVSIGKITHEPDGHKDGSAELPFGWDEVGVPSGRWKDPWAAFFAYADGSTRIPKKTPVSEQADVADTGYPDGLIANAAIRKLRELKGKPFFLAVGFFKPHLPFNAPSRYWRLYNRGQLPVARNPEPPENVNTEISLHRSGEMRGQYTGFSEPGRVTEAEARKLNHAYRACVSYVDAQVGRVLDELDRLGLRENTIVVVWGDHGWHLGEHGIWGKHTLHEVALHSPLLVRLPGIASPGAAADGLIETVDIFPTLAELCGLPIPASLAGRSFVPLLRNPASDGKDAVYGFWRNGRGHTIRTSRHRLVLWTDAKDPSQILQTELYDHESDPLETVNVAAKHPELVQDLASRLRNAVPLLRRP